MIDNRHAVMTAAKDLQGFAGSAASVALLALLDALDTAYSEDLRTVSPDQLGRKQGAAAQVRALRKVLVGHEESPIPKV